MSQIGLQYWTAQEIIERVTQRRGNPGQSEIIVLRRRKKEFEFKMEEFMRYCASQSPALARQILLGKDDDYVVYKMEYAY